MNVTVEIENWVDDFRDTRLRVRSGSLDVTVESENWVDEMCIFLLYLERWNFLRK